MGIIALRLERPGIEVVSRRRKGAVANVTGTERVMPCTKNDVCTGGICEGMAYSCAPPDQCHQAGVCTGDGKCSFAAKGDGAPCRGAMSPGRQFSALPPINATWPEPAIPEPGCAPTPPATTARPATTATPAPRRTRAQEESAVAQIRWSAPRRTSVTLRASATGRAAPARILSRPTGRNARLGAAELGAARRHPPTSRWHRPPRAAARARLRVDRLERLGCWWRCCWRLWRLV
jgi:hypothetical protein